jgi:hypothetical protein
MKPPSGHDRTMRIALFRTTLPEPDRDPGGEAVASASHAASAMARHESREEITG